MDMSPSNPSGWLHPRRIVALVSLLTCSVLAQSPPAPAAVRPSAASGSLRLAGDASTRAQFGEGGRLGQRSIGMEPAWTLRTPGQLWTVQIRAAEDRYTAESRATESDFNAFEGPFESVAAAIQWIRTGEREITLRGEAGFSRHEEAPLSDALTFGALAAARQRFSDRLTVGLALRVQHDFLDDWTVIPVPTFEYRWRPEWSLALDRALALRYRPSPPARDTFGLEIEPSQRAYRLSAENGSAGRMFALRRATAQLRWDRRWTRQISTEMRAGVSLWQELVIKDDERRTVWRGDGDPVGVLAIAVRYARP